MQLKTDGAVTRFYKRTFFLADYDLPKNFCGFFWKLIIAFIVLPITWWTYRVDDKPGRDSPIDDFGSRVGLGVAVPIMLAIVLLIIFGILVTAVSYPKVSTVVASVILFAVLTVWLNTRRNGNPVERFTHEVLDIATTKVESVKDNYCPRIDWK